MATARTVNGVKFVFDKWGVTAKLDGRSVYLERWSRPWRHYRYVRSHKPKYDVERFSTLREAAEWLKANLEV